jgi:hypothetical protein
LPSCYRDAFCSSRCGALYLWCTCGFFSVLEAQFSHILSIYLSTFSRQCLCDMRRFLHRNTTENGHDQRHQHWRQGTQL